TDIILLDFFNTFGMPTSTTVSIVFELLGAAVAVSIIKVSINGEGFSSIAKYINSSKALAIIAGILLSVVIAFIFGAIVQFFTRLIFTFDYMKKLRRYGGIWGGFALSMIIYFILIKGSKGASFITPETLSFIKNNTWAIMAVSFVVSALILQFLMMVFKINILKPIVLIGTFALAMAFAANDLVNFIGVPLAGLNTYTIASANANPLTMTMEALQKPIHTNTVLLLIAGIVMVVTLWFSRKARTVTETEVNLGRQDEGAERFESSALSRIIVRMISVLFDAIRKITPDIILDKFSERLNIEKYSPRQAKDGSYPSFDLLRASVNLMVASAVVSFATSMKLPLSTTYVTFMVAMGTSLSDQAWGRDSAVFRVTGVLTVIGGWFLTALTAFTVSLIFAFAIYYFKIPAVALILALAIYLVWRNFRTHDKKVKEDESVEVFNLKKIKDAENSIETSFKHLSIFLSEISITLDLCIESLCREDRVNLKIIKKETSIIQKWANIITANIFKILRLLQQQDAKTTQNYAQTISSLQEIAESYRDSVMRAYVHISNHHKGLLDIQIDELKQVQKITDDILKRTSQALSKKKVIDYKVLEKQVREQRGMVKKFDKKQIKRIQDDSSKTRLSMLFYGLMKNSLKISEETLNLLKVFQELSKYKH
ncbi:inorganic phosphate transporter, partial [Spirochaetota bacterium]